MTDMTAFESLIAEDVRDEVGPEEAIDALAIARKARADGTRWRFPSMFSTLKFVAAAVIVALFGGFLLAGILTTLQEDEMAPAAVTESPSPMTTEELLSGMVTEEVEPGVLKVKSDGVRDLGGEYWSYDGGVTVGHDGAVWLYWQDGRYVQVGEDRVGDLMVPALRDGWKLVDNGWDDYDFDAGDLLAGPDGQLWYRANDGVRTWQDGDWVLPEGAGRSFESMSVDSSNTAWAATEGSLWWVRPDGATKVDAFPGPGSEPGSLRVTSNGTAYLIVDRVDGHAETLLRFEDGQWHGVPLPTPVRGAWNSSIMDVGADGTLWVATQSETVDELDGLVAAIDGLARYEDGEWDTFSLADAGMSWTGRFCFATPCRMMRVSPDGSVWLDAGIGVEEGDNDCDGLARFDGATWSHVLDEACITDIDFAPDGAAWVLAPTGAYVVRPEDMTEVEGE